MENGCTLCSQCELYKGNISLQEDVHIMYKYHYCLSKSGRWNNCKRFVFANLNGHCPDFVMPNSLLSIDQIWQRTQKGYAVGF